MQHRLSGVHVFKKAFVGVLIAAGLILGPAAPGFTAEKHQEKCPIMGYPIHKKVYADHDGKRVYFCCASCIDEFKKDPEAFLKKMKEDGVELDPAPESKE